MASERASERTFIMVKPDGVQRGLIADIMKRFEQKGFKLVALKLMKVRVYNGYNPQCLSHVIRSPPKTSSASTMTS